MRRNCRSTDLENSKTAESITGEATPTSRADDADPTRWGTIMEVEEKLGFSDPDAGGSDSRRVHFSFEGEAGISTGATISSTSTSVTSSNHTVMSSHALGVQVSSRQGEIPSGNSNALAGRKSFADACAPQGTTHHIHTVRTHKSQSEVHRTQRTFIVRRAPPDMTPISVIKTLAEQFSVPATSLFESVLRDPQDRRRLYLTFRSLKQKHRVEEKGFRLGNVTIKPSDGTLSGYIPFPPYYVDTQTLLTALSSHGQVTQHSFVSTSDGIRIAGFKFNLKLHQNSTAPREIRYGDVSMSIRYDDDLKQCSFCGNFGHLVKYCKKRKSAPAKTANEPSTSPVVEIPAGGLNSESMEIEENDPELDEHQKHAGVPGHDVHNKSPEKELPPAGPTGKTVEELAELKRAWWTRRDALITEEEETVKQLDKHIFCRRTALADVHQEIRSHYRRQMNCRLDQRLRRCRTTTDNHLCGDWKSEYEDLRQKYFDYRIAEHQLFVTEGMPEDTPIHPAGYEPLLTAPEDLGKLEAHHPTLSTEEVATYIAEMSLTTDFRHDLVQMIEESADSDMEVSSEGSTSSRGRRGYSRGRGRGGSGGRGAAACAPQVEKSLTSTTDLPDLQRTQPPIVTENEWTDVLRELYLKFRTDVEQRTKYIAPRAQAISKVYKNQTDFYRNLMGNKGEPTFFEHCSLVYQDLLGECSGEWKADVDILWEDLLVERAQKFLAAKVDGLPDIPESSWKPTIVKPSVPEFETIPCSDGDIDYFYHGAVMNFRTGLEAVQVDDDHLLQMPADDMETLSSSSPVRPPRETPAEKKPPSPEKPPKKKTVRAVPKFEVADYQHFRAMLPDNYDTTECSTVFEMLCSAPHTTVQRWLWHRLRALNMKPECNYINPIATIIEADPTTPNLYRVFTPDPATADILLRHITHTASQFGLTDTSVKSPQPNPNFKARFAPDPTLGRPPNVPKDA